MKTNSNISKHISYKEATKSITASNHGYDNTPNDEQLCNMQYLAEKVFEPLRGYFGIPIAITSFFRSEKVNVKVGGSKTSQHCKGEAMDIDADVLGAITNKQIFNYIKRNLDYDQLIWEFGDDRNPEWVHVSLKRSGTNRKQTLRASKEKAWNGKMITKYKVI